MSFLGVETASERFDFAEDETEAERADVLAKKFSATTGKEPRYQIHTAFWPFLEIAV